MLYIALYLVVEIVAFAAVGSWLGFGWTLLLLLAGGVVGLWLTRREGGRAMQAIVDAAQDRRIAHTELTDGLLVAAGGFLILLPGFVSDLVGLALLLPPSRRLIRSRLVSAAERQVPGLRTARIREGGPVVEGSVLDPDPGPARPRPMIGCCRHRGTTSSALTDPVRWVLQRRRQHGAAAAPRAVQLGLGQEQAAGEVGVGEVSAAQVGPGQVGPAQVGVGEIGPDRAWSRAGSPRSGRALRRSVPTRSAPLWSTTWVARPRQLAGSPQLGDDPLPVPRQVERGEIVRRAAGQALGLGRDRRELVVHRAGRVERQRLAEIPEQLVQLTHDRERGEHPRREARLVLPGPAAEGHLDDLLPGAEAVVARAAGEAAFAEPVVDAASEVGSQVGAGLPGRLVDGELRRRGERRRYAAQRGAARAVRPQPAV